MAIAILELTEEKNCRFAIVKKIECGTMRIDKLEFGGGLYD